MDREGKSPEVTRSAKLEAAVFGPLERATAEDTDPLTLLDTEDALRSARMRDTLRDLVASVGPTHN